MSDTPIARNYSFPEYEEIEARSELRHEFVDGYVRAMAGGTGRHNALAGALFAALRSAAIAHGCLAHVENRRLDIGGTTTTPARTYYPDVMVVCAPSLDAPGDRDPCFVAEVLSESTAAIDQLEKRTAYTNIDSVLVYAIVSQHERRVTVHRRGDDGFRTEVYSEGQSITFDCPPVTIDVDELYLGLGLD